jgi:Zn-dependent protease/predicted transcriptional regulator
MFSHRIPIFRLLGFTVWIDWSWLLLAILIVWTLAVGYFPRLAPHLGEATYWWMGIMGLCGLAFSIIAHEFAHSLVARRYNMPIRGITLFVFGGVAEMEEEPISAGGEFWMALVGPLTSLVLAVIFYHIAGGMAAAGDGSAQSPATVVMTYLAFINGLLAVFNLIPAFPLDGGRMLRSALWGWKGDILWATRIAGAIGSAFGFGLIVLGLLSAITGNFVTGIWWFLLGMFLRTAARASVEQRVMRSTLSGVAVSRVMRRDPLSVSPDLSIERLVQDYFYVHFLKWFPVAAQDGRLVGCVDIRDVKKVDRGEWSSRTVRDVMEPWSDDNSIDETSDAALVLQQMQQTGKSRFLVVENGKLRGVVALRDLINFLSVRAELAA